MLRYFSSFSQFSCRELCLINGTFGLCLKVIEYPDLGNFFFQNIRLIFTVINAHPQFMDIFTHIAHRCYRVLLRYRVDDVLNKDLCLGLV